MKKLDKKEKLIASIMILVIAALLITTIIFVYKYTSYKKSITQNSRVSTVAINISTDNDLSPEYTYSFTGKFEGESLYQFLESENEQDSGLSFNIQSDGFVIGILCAPKSSKTTPMTSELDNGNNQKWQIISPTSGDTTNNGTYNDYCSKGTQELILGQSNSFTFFYGNYSK